MGLWHKRRSVFVSQAVLAYEELISDSPAYSYLGGCRIFINETFSRTKCPEQKGISDGPPHQSDQKSVHRNSLIIAMAHHLQATARALLSH